MFFFFWYHWSIGLLTYYNYWRSTPLIFFEPWFVNPGLTLYIYIYCNIYIVYIYIWSIFPNGNTSNLLTVELQLAPGQTLDVSRRNFIKLAQFTKSKSHCCKCDGSNSPHSFLEPVPNDCRDQNQSLFETICWYCTGPTFEQQHRLWKHAPSISASWNPQKVWIIPKNTLW